MWKSIASDEMCIFVQAFARPSQSWPAFNGLPVLACLPLPTYPGLPGAETPGQLVLIRLARTERPGADFGSVEQPGAERPGPEYCEQPATQR